MTRDSAGRLYGLTYISLALYELQPSATFCAAVLCPWNESILYNSDDGQLGGFPTGIPVLDAQGNVYATSNIVVAEPIVMTAVGLFSKLIRRGRNGDL